MAHETQVLIVGAGPTGLVLALWLTKLGIAVRIIDKTAEPGTTSRAVGVTTRTLELYRAQGVIDPLLADGVQVPAANFWVQGTHAARLPFARMGEGLTRFPFMLIYPQDLHEKMLIDRLAALGVNVERKTALASFEQDVRGVRAQLQRETGEEETCAAAYLAGCDGAHSTVRQTLGIGFPGGTYQDTFYVVDVDATGPAANGEINLDLDQADFLAVFPLKGTGHVRLIGSVHAQPGKDHESLTFDDVGARVIANLKFTIQSVNWFSTYRVHHRVADHFQHGRAFLLGDAAHIHSPAGGQGMNTGIGDAVNLAWKLATVLQGGANASLLATYEPERIRFARQLVATTDRVFTFVTRHGRFAGWVRTRLAPLIVPLLFLFLAVRRFMFRTVSQIKIQYRHSPLSEGAAGRVRGGDRLPWVELARGEDNYAPLAAQSWQVHVYGAPPPAGMADACAAFGLPLHVFAWRPAMRSAGLAHDALYLLRPDSYVAFADPRPTPERLTSYFQTRDLFVAARQ
jgi:2-polyprenyl-6-methoxyphenol hydroxylase-like FAD-dependent oxidoreductase